MNEYSENFDIEKEYIQIEDEIIEINKKYFYMKNNYKSEIEKIEKCFDIRLNIFNLIENQHLIIKQLTKMIKTLISNKQHRLKLDKNINDKNKSPTSINIIYPKKTNEFNGTISLFQNFNPKNYFNINKFINVKSIKTESNVKRSRNRSLSDINFKSKLNLIAKIKEFTNIKNHRWKSKSNTPIYTNFKTNNLSQTNSLLNYSIDIIDHSGKINKENIRNLNTVGNLVPFSATKKLFNKSLDIIQKYENKHRRTKSIGNSTVNFSNCIL